MNWYRWEGDVLILKIHVQPKASRDEVAGLHGDSLKIRITAPPVDGMANERLIRFLAKIFKVAKSGILLVSGETGRDKIFRIKGPGRLPDFPGGAKIVR